MVRRMSRSYLCLQRRIMDSLQRSPELCFSCCGPCVLGDEDAWRRRSGLGRHSLLDCVQDLRTWTATRA